jgi:hypothetical protein
MMETILPLIHIKNLSTLFGYIFFIIYNLCMVLFCFVFVVFFFHAFDFPFECNMVDVLNDNHVKHLRKLNNGWKWD